MKKKKYGEQFQYFTQTTAVALFLALIFAALVAGCSGSSDSGGGEEAAAPTGQQANILTPAWGRFVDSPVQGLMYYTPLGTGYTDSEGRYQYAAGEYIHFFIGEINLAYCNSDDCSNAFGSVLAKPVMTPVDLVAGAYDAYSPHVANICRFLLTLDEDGNPDNGIVITPQTREAGMGKHRHFDFTRSCDDFARIDGQDVTNLALEAGLGPRELVSAQAAADHMNQTLERLCVEHFYGVLQDHYLWYRDIPWLDLDQYQTSDEMLEDAIYRPRDRWSYVMDRRAFEAYDDSGRYIGLGYSLVWSNNEVRVRFTFPGSPTSQAGLKRGDTILAINNMTIQEIDALGLWGAITGPDEPGTRVHLRVRTLANDVLDMVVFKDWIQTQPILHQEVIQAMGKNIGYLALFTFDPFAEEAILDAMAWFKQQGVDEMVVDLRYNTGGTVRNAWILASLLGGDTVMDEVFVRYDHNDKNTDLNRFYEFANPADALDLNRVFFITGFSTCSASELVINSLNPFLDVFMAGDDTCGKPVGMHVYNHYNQTLVPVEFYVKNAIGNAQSFSGFAPDVYTSDNLGKALGDPAENSLAAVLDSIAGKSFSGDPDKEADKSGLPDPVQRVIRIPGIKGLRGIM